MQLLTKEIKNSLPSLYSTEDVPLDDKIVQVKYFNPCGAGTWYGVEYDPEENMFFGYVDLGFGDTCSEWGYFSLDELESIKLPFGLGIERDLYFKPTKFSETPLGKRKGIK